MSITKVIGKTGSICYVVLVYKFTSDLEKLTESLRTLCGSHVFQDIIVLENYSTESSRIKCQEFCENRGIYYAGCYKNDGYGAGNNRGIKLAYDRGYEYIAVLNPDVEILTLPLLDLDKLEGCVFGPSIIREKGGNQNPYWAYRVKFFELLIYLGARYNSTVLLISGVFGHKMLKILWKILNSNTMIVDVFSLHGSAIFFHRAALQKLGKPFDENIFLYTEEEDLAYQCRSESVPMKLCRNILVKHNEDGSSGGEQPALLGNITRLSIIYRYKKWHH